MEYYSIFYDRSNRKVYNLTNWYDSILPEVLPTNLYNDPRYLQNVKNILMPENVILPIVKLKDKAKLPPMLLPDGSGIYNRLTVNKEIYNLLRKFKLHSIEWREIRVIHRGKCFDYYVSNNYNSRFEFVEWGKSKVILTRKGVSTEFTPKSENELLENMNPNLGIIENFKMDVILSDKINDYDLFYSIGINPYGWTDSYYRTSIGLKTELEKLTAPAVVCLPPNSLKTNKSHII